MNSQVEFIPLPEAAVIMRVSYNGAHKALLSGDMKWAKIGGRLYVLRADAENYVRRKYQDTPGAPGGRPRVNPIPEHKQRGRGRPRKYPAETADAVLVQ